MEWFYWLFTIWAKILHYTDVVRVLTVTVFKVIGFFQDSMTDYLIDDGLKLKDGNTKAVSMSQTLTGTDWYMESFGLTVSFSLYGDLLGISEWATKDQEACIKNGLCQESVQKEKVYVKKASGKKAKF